MGLKCSLKKLICYATCYNTFALLCNMRWNALAHNYQLTIGTLVPHTYTNHYPNEDIKTVFFVVFLLV